MSPVCFILVLSFLFLFCRSLAQTATKVLASSKVVLFPHRYFYTFIHIHDIKNISPLLYWHTSQNFCLRITKQPLPLVTTSAICWFINMHAQLSTPMPASGIFHYILQRGLFFLSLRHLLISCKAVRLLFWQKKTYIRPLRAPCLIAYQLHQSPHACRILPINLQSSWCAEQWHGPWVYHTRCSWLVELDRRHCDFM